MKPRHTARAIVPHDSQLLLMERWRGDKHYFSIPGGGIEPGETPEQTVVREVLEETGCQVQVTRQVYLVRLHDGTEHSIYLCEYLSGEPHLPVDSPEALLGDPNNRFRPTWVPIADLPDTPFLVWQPLKPQLLHDLSSGFSPDALTL